MCSKVNVLSLSEKIKEQKKKDLEARLAKSSSSLKALLKDHLNARNIPAERPSDLSLV